MSEIINAAWEAHKTEESHRAERAAARAALFQELVARRNALQELALDILARTGSREARYSDDIADEQLSPAISLGKLESADAEGRSFAFARVFVTYDQELVERTIKGRFFKHTEFEYVRSDRISSFGVRFIAAHEDGCDGAYVGGAYWSIANGYRHEEFNRIEAYFGTITTVLDANPSLHLVE